MFPLAAAALLALAIAGCRKAPYPFPGGYTHARIEKIQVDSGYFSENTGVFAYNTDGNPVTITRSVAGTGMPNYIFRYDARQRLTDYAGVYTGSRNTFESWHHYTYNSRDLIITDTMYIFGLVTDNGPVVDPESPYEQLYIAQVSSYEYDAQHRIIKAYDSFGQPPARLTRYIYGADGNLAVVRSYDPFTQDSTDTHYSGYDHKVNLHRTHPIWQFLDRDFSLNNRTPVLAYNAQGLPLVIAPPAHTELSPGFISFFYSQSLFVTYQPCL